MCCSLFIFIRPLYSPPFPQTKVYLFWKKSGESKGYFRLLQRNVAATAIPIIIAAVAPKISFLISSFLFWRFPQQGVGLIPKHALYFRVMLKVMDGMQGNYVLSVTRTLRGNPPTAEPVAPAPSDQTVLKRFFFYAITLISALCFFCHSLTGIPSLSSILDL